MAEKTVEERVKQLVSEHLGVEIEKLIPEARFEILGADSLDQVEIVMAVEEEFKISIPEDEDYKVETFGELVKLVEKHVEAKDA